MKLSFRLVMAWLVALSFACTDHGTGPSTSTDATIALRPSFSTAGAAQATRDIHRIRLVVRAEGTTDVLLRSVVDVEPSATSWSVPLDVPFVAGRRIVVSIELINVAADGTESVEWSGVTPPIALTAGATIENGVEVFPGPLDNLQIRSLTLEEIPTEMVEGDFELLRAVVDAPAGLALRVFWTSSSPEVMSVDSTGRVVALLPGTTRIIAQAGQFADTAVIVVRAAARSIEVTPSSVLLEHVGAEALLTGRVLDARGAAVPGTTVEWSVSDAAVLQDLGGGSVRALAPGTATVTATSPQAPGLSGAATIDVVQSPAAITVSPDVVVLNALGATAPLSAVVEDAGGSAIAGIAVDWSSADHGIATVSADGVITAVGDGTTTITAAAAGLSAGVQVTVARSPARLTVIAGDGQTAAVGAAVAVAPAVRVEDANGHAVAGIEVAFSIAACGGTVAIATATSDAAGAASAGSWTLGTAIGENRLTATVSGITPLTFTATAVAGPPAAIIGVAGDGQTAAAGSAVPVPPAVRVNDAHGNAVAGATVAFTASGDGSITPATVATDAAGVAAATSWQLGTIAGTYTAQAAVDGAGTVVFTATAEAGAPALLEMIAGNDQTADAGSALPVAPAVRVADAHGNGVAGVTVTFAVGSGGGSVTGATVVTDGDGLAAAGGWTLGTSTGGNTLIATAGGLTVTFTATARAGAPALLEITAGNGQTAPAGSTLPVAPSVRVADAHGNGVAGVTVTFAVATGGGSVTGATVVTDAAGSAAVGGWTLGTSAGENTLIATAGELTVTFTATAQAGAPAVLEIIAGNGQSAAAGTALPIAPSVRVADAQGNGVAGMTVTFAVGTGAGAITPTTVVTDATGTATATSWTLGTAAGENTLTATAGELTATFTATAQAGAAAALEIIAGNGQSAAAGTALPIAPSVRVADAQGNGVAGVTVTFAVATGGGSVTPATVVTDAAGTATATSWTLGTAAGENTLVATAGELTATFTATAQAGAPAVLEIVAGAGQTATAGTALPVAPSVRVADAQGNGVGGVTVTFTVGTGGGSVTPATVVTDPTGAATVTSWTLGTAAGENTLVATAGESTATFTATAQAGAPAALEIVAGDGQTATAGSALPVAPSVRLADANGNGVAGVTVTFIVGTGGGSVTPATVVTDAAGTATATSWTLGTAAGENTLVATAGELTATFTATAVVEADPCAAVPITIGTLATGQLSPTGCTVEGVPVQHFSLVLTAQTELTSTIATPVAFQPTLSFGDVVIPGDPVEGGSSIGGMVLPAGSYQFTVASLSTESAAVTIDMQTGEPTSCMELFTVVGLTIDGNLTTTDCVPGVETPQYLDNYSVFLTAGTTVQWSATSAVPVTLAVVPEAGGVPLVHTPTGSTSPVLTQTVPATGIYYVQIAAVEALATGAYALSMMPVAPPATVTVHAGADQTAPAGEAVTTPPAVIVRDAGATPVAGVPVTFTVTSGAGIITGGAATGPTATVVYTNSAGVAALDSWILGATPGVNTVAATVAGIEGAVTFTATGESADPLMTIDLVDRTFVGVSFTAPLRVTINQPAPAGGLSVAVFSDDGTRLLIDSPGTITIPEGATTGTITVSGIAAGVAPVRAVATGFPDASASIQVSLRLISLPTTLNVPFGHNASLPVQLAEPAPDGGTVVSLTSSDPSRVEVLTPTVTVLAGATTANAVVYGALPGPATLSATATEYIAGSSAATTRAELELRSSTGSTQLTINEAFGGSLRLRLRSAGSDIAAPSPGVTVTLAAVDPTCVNVPSSVVIPTGLTQVSVPASYGGSATTSCTTRVRATGANLVADSMTVRVDPTPAINLSGTQVGSGLQRSWNGNLGASNHPGVTVRITSSDPTKLLIAPDGNTPGSAFLDIPVATGNSGFGFWVQGVEGVVADVNVTATATGFTDRTVVFNVQQPALQLSGLNANTTTLTGDDPFRVQIGLPYSGNSALWQSMAVRAGAPALVATVTTGNTEVGRLITATDDAASVTVEIPAGTSISASTVAAGGAALRPIGEGVTAVAATIPGYIATTAAATSVTVTAPIINMSGTQIGSGLQRSWSGSLGAYNHGGVIVRITSADPTKLLIAADGNTVGSAFIDVPVADGNNSFGFWLQGIEDVVADVAVTVSVPGFTDRTATFNVQQPALQLSGVNTSTTTLTGDDAFRVQIGLPYAGNSALWQSMVLRAGAPALVATVTSSTPAVGELLTGTATAASATVEIPAGTSISASSVATGGIALRPTGEGQTTVAASIPGYITTTAASSVVTVTSALINMSGTQIASGLQRSWSGSLGAANHSGVTVRITSADPAKLLIAPDGNTAGSAFLDIPVAAGNTGFGFWLQGIEDVVADVNVTVSAPGFVDRTVVMNVQQPAVQLINLNAGTTTLTGDDAFRVQIGLPYAGNSSLWQSQAVRAGAPALTINVTGTTTAGQLITQSASGGSVSVQIPAGSSVSPSSVATGGVALRPLTAGTTVISAAATGYITTTAGSQAVTITAPAITISGTTIGAGLQRSWSGSLGASNHSGVTVRLTSSNASFVVLAPDGSTVGTGTLDVVVPAGQTSFGFWLQGVEGATGSISVMASASGFTDGSGTIEVVQPGFQLSGLSGSTNTAANDDPFRVQVGLPYDNHSGLWQSMAVRAGGSLTASVTSSDEAVGTLVTTAATARTVTVTIDAGQSLSGSSVAAGGVALRPLTAGATTVSTTIPGLIATDNASGTVNIAQASIGMSTATVGAGLQASSSGFLSGPAHGGVTVRLTSSDPTRLLLAPDAFTAGAAFIDVNVASGSTGFSYFVQGLEGTTGTVAVTAGTAGFTDGTASHDVVQPAVEIIELQTSMLATAADDPFRVRVGIPNSGTTGFSQIQNVRAGGALTATVTSDAPAVGQLVTEAVTGASVSVEVPGNANTSPTSVAAGGVAFDAQTAGTASIAVSIPGFIQLPTATRTITISN